MNRLCKVTSIFCLFFLLFVGLAFYETFNMYNLHGLEWTTTVDGVIVEEDIWSHVGSCIFACLILMVLVANLEYVMRLEQYIKNMES